MGKIKNVGKGSVEVVKTLTWFIVVMILLTIFIFGGLALALLPLWLWIGGVDGWAWGFFATVIGFFAALTSIGRILRILQLIIFGKKPESDNVKVIIIEKK